jgi:hypothetical protein
MTRSRLACTAVIACALASYAATCGNVATLRKDDQDAVRARYEGKRLFLRSSMYYGPFFGDRKTYLLATRAFGELRLIEGLDGVPIPPGKEEGVVPAGREVLVERIEFPPAERPLLTPRFYPWVYLKVDKTFTDRPHVVVLQLGGDTLVEFEQAIGAYLVEKDPRPAIAGRPQPVREAIDAKAAVGGMTEDDLVTSLGMPDAVRHVQDKDGHTELWAYPRRCVTMREGKVAAVSDGACK